MPFSLKTLRLLQKAGASERLLSEIMQAIQEDFGVPIESMQLPVEPRAIRRSRRNAPVSPERRKAVYERDKFTCVYCGKGDPLTVSTLTVDHKVPRSRGGTNDLENLVTACGKCNHAKADLTVEEYLAGHRPTRLRPGRPYTPPPQSKLPGREICSFDAPTVAEAERRLSRSRKADRDIVLEAQRALAAASLCSRGGHG